MRIPPDSVPGYIADLRETNSSGDGKGRAKPSLQWKPKALQSPTMHNDGEVPRANAHTNPPVGARQKTSPIYDLLRWKLRASTLYLTQTIGPNVEPSTTSIPRHDRSIPTERHASLETRMDQVQPEQHPMVGSWATDYVDSPAQPFSITLLMGALKAQSQSGSSKQQILSLEALEVYTRRKDGHRRVTQSYWGNVIRRGDFTAQEITVARFHFQVIDFGDPIALQDSPMRSTGNVENVARNQCVLLHLQRAFSE